MAERLAKVLKDLADKGKLQESLDVLESAATSTGANDNVPSKFNCTAVKSMMCQLITYVHVCQS